LSEIITLFLHLVTSVAVITSEIASHEMHSNTNTPEVLTQ